jgi:HEAT repeat protein
MLLLMSSICLAQEPRVDFLGKTADKWLEDLNKDDARLRRNAAFALGKMGSGADMAQSALTRVLQMDSSETVREAAAYALGEICKGGKGLNNDTFAALQTALQGDRDPLVRRSAAFALGSIGSASPTALQALERALADASPGVRQNAAWALGRLGPTAVPALRKALTDADAVVCRDAAASCGLIGKDAHPLLPELLACCTPERDPELRKMALSVLVKLVGPDDKLGVQILTRSLADRDIEIKRNAALALSNIGGPDAAAAVPILLDALRGGDLELKRTAAAALKNIGKDARAALPALRDALHGPDEELRVNAAVAIGGMGDAAAPVVRDLVRHLADPAESPRVRVEAAVALSRIGPVPAAVEAVPTIIGVLKNPANESKVRERTLWALIVHQGNMRNLKVFRALTEILSEPKLHETRMLRYLCAYVLAMYLAEETPGKALDALLDHLKDDSTLIYTGTTASAGGTGTESNAGKTEIKEKGIGDGRVTVIDALERVGRARVRARKDIVEQLQALADDPQTNAELRRRSQELLRKLKK